MVMCTFTTMLIDRHLYMEPLSTCYVFQGCSPLFLDSVMMACKVELFMPKVSSITNLHFLQIC